MVGPTPSGIRLEGVEGEAVRRPRRAQPRKDSWPDYRSPSTLGTTRVSQGQNVMTSTVAIIVARYGRSTGVRGRGWLADGTPYGQQGSSSFRAADDWEEQAALAT